MNPESVSPDVKRRTSHIEGRDDLFETKALRVKLRGEATPPDDARRLLVVSRDPGSAAALVPVVEQLTAEGGIACTALVDGRAEEHFRKSFETEAVGLPDGPLAVSEAIGTPNLILTDTSASERGLETYAAVTYPDVPLVLIEDFYGTANAFLRRLDETRDNAEGMIPKPEKICVMDEAARALILEEFPELANRVIVTGQPAFDRFAHEDRTRLREDGRGLLGLRDADLLVTFMGAPDQLEVLQKMLPGITVAAERARGAGQELHFVFRRHPRDNVSDAEYQAAITGAGIAIVPAATGLSMDAVMTASDIVMTNTSLTGVEAAYRRIPVLYVNDVDVWKPSVPMRYPLPPVALGVSAAVYDVQDIGERLSTLIDPASDVRTDMASAMEQQYVADGKSAARVAEVAKRYLG